MMMMYCLWMYDSFEMHSNTLNGRDTEREMVASVDAEPGCLGFSHDQHQQEQGLGYVCGRSDRHSLGSCLVRGFAVCLSSRLGWGSRPGTSPAWPGRLES